MEVLQVAGLALVTLVVLLLIRQDRPELAVQLTMALGAVIFALVLGRVLGILEALETLATRAGVDRYHLGTVLRIIGVAYVAEFAAQVCRDAGEGAVAGKVEMAGKVLILAMALPIILAVLDAVLGVLP
ncbi:MAG: stage III sporulation protein AD [bacterium]|nr:stage III sporulation protein AD [bacterium]